MCYAKSHHCIVFIIISRLSCWSILVLLDWSGLLPFEKVVDNFDAEYEVISNINL